MLSTTLSGRQACYFFVLLQLAIAQQGVFAVLHVVDPKGHRTSARTATFEYFGKPAYGVSITKAGAYYLTGADICDPPESAVHGKVVFTDGKHATCPLSQAYDALDKLGALALVSLSRTYRPGLACYLHYTWDPETYALRSMLFVDVSHFAVDADTWKATLMSGVEVSLLAPPHDRDTYVLYNSIPWLILMRVLLPVAALWTVIDAAIEMAQLYNHFRAKRNVQPELTRIESIRIVKLIIVAVEVPCCLYLGIAHVFGQYGPTYLPFNVHRVCHYGFTGVSVATTLLIALLIRDDSMALKHLHPNRHVLDHYRGSVVVIIVLLFGFDVFYVINVSTFNVWRFSAATIFCSISAFILIQLGAAIYFFVQARALNVGLSERFEITNIRNLQLTEKKILRLFFWLMITGAACLVSTFTLFIFLAVFMGWLEGAVNTTLMLLLLFSFSGSRVLLAYSQVQLVKQKGGAGICIWIRENACNFSRKLKPGRVAPTAANVDSVPANRPIQDSSLVGSLEGSVSRISEESTNMSPNPSGEMNDPNNKTDGLPAAPGPLVEESTLLCIW
mmetsp:Transcript_68867/g.155791  ORF Transcript_68867/g.155791 Transcript_68867/m.155791 type:complete len:560 (-) Transcript_68867:507-2186(-)